MKKIFSIILYITISLLLIFTIKSNAASLDTLVITTDKQTIHPGENVVVNIDFGQNLGAYTFDVAYDNNLFEYVTSNGGTANDTGSKVRVFYFDQTGGATPRANMSVTFKAKSGITTSNPTEFLITAEGLTNSDTTIEFDDITTPIVKNVVVENITPPQETPEEKPTPPQETPEETPTTPQEKPTTPTTPEKVEKLPESLPKTGYNVLAISVVIMLALAGVYVSLNKKS